MLGYSVTFIDNKCRITDLSEVKVGKVPKLKKGLYHIIHKVPKLTSKGGRNGTYMVVESI